MTAATSKRESRRRTPLLVSVVILVVTRNFQTATEILVGQLLDAHKELSTLKKALRHEKHLADAAQTGVAGVLKMMDRGKEVFASDPNDISVQQAALDSLLSQGKRLTAKVGRRARTGDVWWTRFVVRRFKAGCWESPVTFVSQEPWTPTRLFSMPGLVGHAFRAGR